MALFRFKRFAVEQEGVAMRIGTDGVLLGAWVDMRGDEHRILDIGTGTGVIALMAAQRSTAEYIAAIDSDAASAQRAAANFADSPWSERLCAHHIPVQEFCAEEPFDLIISNPPYFVDSLPAPDARRTAARHTVSLPLEQLNESICRLTAPHGRAALILPPQQMEYLISITPLHLIRRCDVRSVAEGEIKRVMAEFARQQPSPCTRHEQLTIETASRGTFSNEYRQLTKDFYLKF